MSVLQKLLSPLVREYWIGRTFVHRAGQPAGGPSGPPPGIVLGPLPRSGADPAGGLSGSASPAAPEYRRFGATWNGEIVGACTFAFGEGYRREGGFYDLRPQEAELTDIFTESRHRGKGVAAALIRYSAERMHEEGFHTLYAKVWHSNTPSSRAFRSAGWHAACFFIRFRLRGRRGVCHWEWRPE
jgi:GNAT superfamily N-acetyltransferase